MGSAASEDVCREYKRPEQPASFVGKLRPYLAKVTRPDYDGYCVGEFLVLRPRNEELLSQYHEKPLRSKPVIDAVNASTFGAGMPRADWHFIGNMALPFPPLAEQSAIAAHLDNTVVGIDTARARLIAGAVSCKPNLREAADRGAPIPDNGNMKREAIEGKVTA